MTPEQEIRAAAISAAATFCAPIGGASNGHIPAPEDVLFVADVFYGYVQGGWEEALKVYATSEKQQAAPTVRNVELREGPPVEDILLPELGVTAHPSTSGGDPSGGQRPQGAGASRCRRHPAGGARRGDQGAEQGSAACRQDQATAR